MSKRIAALPLCLAAMIPALSGCSAGEGEGNVDGPVTIYVSVPLSGPGAQDGRDAAEGARLAVDQAAEAATAEGDLGIEIEVLDGAKPDPMVAAAANARTAAQDSSTALYVGELESAPTRNSLPVLNDAGIAQISPTAGADDLTSGTGEFEDSPERYRPSGEVTFARVVPGERQVRSAEANGADRFGAVLEPSSLGAGKHRFTEDFTGRFGHPPGPYAAYGYVAAQLAIEAIGEADGPVQGFRARVADELLSTALTGTPLGDFGIENDGSSTLCLVQPYAAGKPLEPVCVPPPQD